MLLKFFYIFKRRLYMEHLLVALHSHSFIFMSILVLLLLAWLADLAASIGWLVDVIGVFSVVAWIWLFLYLLVMQKRVYRQGWFMTVLKCDVGSAAWLLEPTYASTDHRPDPSLHPHL